MCTERSRRVTSGGSPSKEHVPVLEPWGLKAPEKEGNSCVSCSVNSSAPSVVQGPETAYPEVTPGPFSLPAKTDGQTAKIYPFHETLGQGSFKKGRNRQKAISLTLGLPPWFSLDLSGSTLA